MYQLQLVDETVAEPIIQGIAIVQFAYYYTVDNKFKLVLRKQRPPFYDVSYQSKAILFRDIT